MFAAPLVDGFKLFFELSELPLQLRWLAWIQTHVIACMVSDLEAVAMQLCDLVPGHIVLLVRLEVKSFSDEESRTKLVLQQNWSHYGEV